MARGLVGPYMDLKSLSKSSKTFGRSYELYWLNFVLNRILCTFSYIALQAICVVLFLPILICLRDTFGYRMTYYLSHYVSWIWAHILFLVYIVRTHHLIMNMLKPMLRMAERFSFKKSICRQKVLE